MNPMKIDVLTVGTEVWLHVKRWDRDILERTAVERVNFSDLDGAVYSIAFENGMVQVSGGYGIYWWCYEKKPEGWSKMAFDQKAYQREYQKKYQKGMNRILLTFNPSNENDVKMWEYLQALGSRNRIPFIKTAIADAMKKDSSNV